MSEEQSRYKLQLVDRETDTTHTVRLSLRALRLLAMGVGAGAALVAVGSIFSIYTLTHAYLHEEETAQLREANRIQQEQIRQIAKKASALGQEVDAIQRTEDGLRALVGAPPAETDSAVQEGDAAPAPTGGAPHTLTTDEVGEALTMLEERTAVRRTSIGQLAAMMQKDVPGASSFLGDDTPVTTPTGWPTDGFISSGYGLRWNGAEFHQGIDIAAEMGTPIVATADGVVTIAGWNAGGYGNMVDIDHGSGVSTRYGHASAVVVTVGQRVRRGQIIAYVGSTGHSTGPHLHYEVRLSGQPVNPTSYL
ncbi:M23 family metallopeptidase [Selenomonas sp. oral taxon 136]|uniref:M23 family metallopeptidase n=1 Tax=Selenomonas sp. oral taxon 136 TaxID=713030 RepID=UPI000767F9B1|nr:M23 family metallopeptidase [Selenomonas sp. oral taxon 136]AME03548.1 peptidase M23 [Selenomonas sp. oral taxon 136]